MKPNITEINVPEDKVYMNDIVITDSSIRL